MSLLSQPLRTVKRYIKSIIGRDLFITPDIQIPTERLGSDYGGWDIYDVPLTSDSVIYTFGVGEDISFDLALISRFRVTVHAFDPTPRSMAWVKQQSLPDQFKFHDIGIADEDGQMAFYPPAKASYVSFSSVNPQEGTPTYAPVQRLTTIMNTLRHTHLDLLKMDIEGSEYKVIEDILASEIPISQIMVEFHHRFPSVGNAMTQQAVRQLRAKGYRLFAVSPSGEEYSFIRQDLLK